MDPWAVFILLVALALIVIAVKGKQDNAIAAITGKPYRNSTLR